jgi:hypothetical protein
LSIPLAESCGVLRNIVLLLRAWPVAGIPLSYAMEHWLGAFTAATGAPPKKVADFEPGDWKKAQDFMKSGKVPRGGLQRLSALLHVPRPTLSNRFRSGSISNLGKGRPTVIPFDQEKLLAARATEQNTISRAWNNRLALKKTRVLAEAIGISADCITDMRFLKRIGMRHGMSTKIAEKTSDARTLAMNRPAMARHFKRLEDAGWADAPPHLLCNADETSLTDNGSKKEKVR